MISDVSQDFYSALYRKLYKLMLQGFDLESISEKTGCKKSYILKVFKSELFHIIINVIGVYYQIYTVKEPFIMRILLDGLASKIINDIDFFKDPDDYVRDFYYVDNHWVKKDINGCIVDCLEQLPLPEHFDDEWFKILRTRHQLMMSEHLV